MTKNRKSAPTSGRKPLKPKKISVLLDDEQLERFERYCRNKGFKKSTLVARLIREHLELEGFSAEASKA